MKPLLARVALALAVALIMSSPASAQPFMVEYDLPSLCKVTIYSVIAITLGLFFYRLRCNHRFLYGMCEVIASVFWFTLVLYPRSPTFTATIQMPPFVPPLYTIYGFLAGIYIFVRGMDNMHCGLTSETWRKSWDRLFRCPLPVRKTLTSWLSRRE
jgi:hypothetical protein